jgi:excisionase family DNA binding protein
MRNHLPEVLAEELRGIKALLIEIKGNGLIPQPLSDEPDDQLPKTNLSLDRQSRVLNIDELCAYTGYAKSYVYKLINAGTIPYSNPTGKKLWFDREKIDLFLLGAGSGGKEKREVSAATYISTHKL